MAAPEAQPAASTNSELSRPFELVLFDWDGTAVPDRYADAAELATTITGALERGILFVLVTGTSFENIDRQLIRLLPRDARRNLFVCTNRGSEVRSFDAAGAPVIRYRREASAEENLTLDRAAHSLQDYLRGFGLHTEIVWNRMNRRKIDLIPTEKWRDPKKAQFAELARDVDARLRSAGLLGGLAKVLQESVRIAGEAGLRSPRITSDLKHVEIGLTDKSDSAAWARDELMRERGISAERVAILGDEFGGVGSVQGSDSLMRVPGLEAATVISVGAEPNGVPESVVHLPGGPARFAELLRLQIQERDAPTRDPSWLLEQEGFDPYQEGEMETLFSIGNGRLGVRGACDILIPVSQPDLLIAGVYDHKAEVLPYSELEFVTKGARDSRYAEIVPLPSPFSFKVRVAGEELDPGSDALVKHSRRLDLKRAIAYETFEFTDEKGRRTRIRSSHCASLHEPRLLLQEIEICCWNHADSIELDMSFIDPDTNLRYPHIQFEHPPSANGTSDAHIFRTRSSGIEICLASHVCLDGSCRQGPKLSFEGGPGKPRVIRKWTAVATTREPGSPLEIATGLVRERRWSEFDGAIVSHCDAWSGFWKRADLRLGRDPARTQAARFTLYQQRISADTDPRVSVAARGLTGRAYEGHVFWDTEIFLLPFFIHTSPEIARSLLEYRYNTLDGARRRASAMGYRGACFAWESSLTGADVTPSEIYLKSIGREIPIFTGKQQIHITADVAYAVWRYWDATLDEDFLAERGAEILIETARFWTSRVRAGDDGAWHIPEVIGPDEYHYGTTDNAFTNRMAKLNLEKAAWAAEWVASRAPDALKRTELSGDEPARWRSIASRLFLGAVSPAGVIEQFAGFFALEPPRISKNDLLKGPFERLLAWEETNRRKTIKQADVLMIPFLFPEAWEPGTLAANYHYYEPLTDHGSSLSPSVHAAIAARIGAYDDARRYWEMALNLDLMNLMRNTALGIHIGNAGGLWQALVFHILGVRFVEGRPVAPERAWLPMDCESVELTLAYRGRQFPIRVRNAREATR